jgi:hypothetical protein
MVYGVALIVTDGLTFEAVKDEGHFFASSQSFSESFPPSLEDLRSYPEVVTPLALVVWGQLDRLTGNGLLAGRWLNWLLSMGLMYLVMLGAGGRTRGAVIAGVGLLAFPYTMALSVHLYTDIPALFLGLVGLHFHLRRLPFPAFLFFALAIATRQYLVLLPAAAAGAAAWSVLRGDRSRWFQALSAGAAVATLLGWFAFFGGLAPQPGMDYWLPRYPAPMLESLAFRVDYGLYALTGLAVYFVVPEAILFPGRFGWRDLRTPRAAIAALVVAASVLAVGHVLVDSEPGGPFGRIVGALLAGESLSPIRTAIFAVLAWVTAVRFSRSLDLESWLVLGCFALAMKSQLPWEKYLLPTLGALWYVRSRDGLDDVAEPGAAGAHAAESGA